MFVSSRLIVLVFSCVLFVLLGQESCAQRNANANAKLGDIVKYQANPRSEMKYGLVIAVKPRMSVEYYDSSGEIQSERIIGVGNVEVVDPYKKQAKIAMRKWMTKDGKFDIKAKLTGVADDKVKLEKSDGSTVNVPLSKLSKNDRRYAERMADTVGDEFEVDLPSEVMELRVRRSELLEVDDLHQQLAKMNSEFMVGDIIEFKDFFNGKTLGIVAETDGRGTVEYYDERMEKTSTTSLSRLDSWSFVDREMVGGGLDSRMWKTSNGKFSVKARLTDVADGKLTLEKMDGTTVKVPLSKLSDLDQKYVKRVRSKLGKQSNDQLAESRLSYTGELKRLLDRRLELVAKAADNKIASKAASRMKNIRLSSRPFEPGNRDFKPQVLGNELDFSMKFPMLVVEKSSVRSVALAKEGRLVAMTAGNSFRGKPTLAVVDLDSQDVTTSVDSDELGDDAGVVAISPSGAILVVFSKENRKGQLELWKYSDGRLERVNVISYESSQKPKGYLFNDQSGVIQNSRGAIVFFDVEGRITPTHKIDAERGSVLQISEDRKTLFYLDNQMGKLHVLDATTKTSTGSIDFPKSPSRIPNSVLKIAPDGKSVAFANDSVLQIVDLKSGKVSEEFKFDKNTDKQGDKISFGRMTAFSGLSRGDFRYYGDGVVQANNTLYDLGLGLKIGRVKSGFGASNLNFADAARIVASSNRRSGRADLSQSIASDDFDQATPEARRKRRKEAKYAEQQTELKVERLDAEGIVNFANSLSESDVVEFSNGDTVALRFDLEQGKNLENQFRRRIEEQMTSAGIKLVESSDFVFELSFKVGEPVTQKFRIIGMGPIRDRTVTVTPKTGTARLTYKGETIWARSVSGGLGNPGSEEQLNKNVKNASSISPRQLLDFEYPAYVRVVLPSRQQDFEWR